MTDIDDDPRRMLDRLLTEKGVDYAQLSARIGRNPAYIQQYIKRGSPRRLGEQDRARIAAYLGVSEALLGGPALDFTSNAIEATLAAGERVIVWENPRDGMPEKNGIRFADTSLARSYDASRLGIVHMPALTAELEGKDFQKMAEGFLTFAQATADDSFSRMARHRLAKLWAAYAEQADVMMGVAHV